jgi:DNA-binding transcriptional LysR family regulator
MDIKQLIAFRSVMENRSASKAGIVLGITQPAVSGLIGRLERQLGVALFTRRGRRLEPTAEAKFLYTKVLQTLEGIERLENSILEFRQAQGGTLTIAAHPTASIFWLPGIAARFRHKHKDVSIRLLTRSSEHLRESVSSDSFDFGIAETVVEKATITAQRFKFRCVAVLPVHHPLAAHKVITPNLLNGVPFIALTRWQSTYFEVSRAFSHADTQWNVAAECEFFATALSIVSQGGGVTISEPISAQTEAKKKTVVLRRFEPEIPYEFAVFHPSDRPLSLLASEFLADLTIYIEEMIKHNDRQFKQ